MFVRRALDTGDEKDYVFPLDQEFDMGYAYHDSANEMGWTTKHQVAGSFKVTLNSNGDPVLGSMPEPEPEEHEEDHGDDKDDDKDDEKDEDVDSGNVVIEDDGLDIPKVVLSYIEEFVNDGASGIIGTLGAVSLATAMLY